MRPVSKQTVVLRFHCLWLVCSSAVFIYMPKAYQKRKLFRKGIHPRELSVQHSFWGTTYWVTSLQRTNWVLVWVGALVFRWAIDSHEWGCAPILMTQYASDECKVWTHLGSDHVLKTAHFLSGAKRIQSKVEWHGNVVCVLYLLALVSMQQDRVSVSLPPIVWKTYLHPPRLYYMNPLQALHLAVRLSMLVDHDW